MTRKFRIKSQSYALQTGVYTTSRIGRTKPLARSEGLYWQLQICKSATANFWWYKSALSAYALPRVMISRARSGNRCPCRYFPLDELVISKQPVASGDGTPFRPHTAGLQANSHIYKDRSPRQRISLALSYQSGWNFPRAPFRPSQPLCPKTSLSDAGPTCDFKGSCEKQLSKLEALFCSCTCVLSANKVLRFFKPRCAGRDTTQLGRQTCRICNMWWLEDLKTASYIFRASDTVPRAVSCSFSS